MKHFLTLVLGFVVAITIVSAAVAADECFISSKKLTDDAQTIRLKAMEMGWKVGKTSSLAAAAVVSGKSGIYPQDTVNICLREEDGALQIKAQSESRDAGKAKWRGLTSKKIGAGSGDRRP
jgi:hypothetical protein